MSRARSQKSVSIISIANLHNSVLKDRLTANNAVKSLSAVPEIVNDCVLDMGISDFGTKVLDIFFNNVVHTHFIGYVL